MVNSKRFCIFISGLTGLKTIHACIIKISNNLCTIPMEGYQLSFIALKIDLFQEDNFKCRYIF